MKTHVQLGPDHPYPNFAEALKGLGRTHTEIASLLGVSPRSVFNYLAGIYLPPTPVVKSHPAIDQALTLDFAAQRAASSPITPSRD